MFCKSHRVFFFIQRHYPSFCRFSVFSNGVCVCNKIQMKHITGLILICGNLYVLISTHTSCEHMLMKYVLRVMLSIFIKSVGQEPSPTCSICSSRCNTVQLCHQRLSRYQHSESNCWAGRIVAPRWKHQESSRQLRLK